LFLVVKAGGGSTALFSFIIEDIARYDLIGLLLLLASALDTDDGGVHRTGLFGLPFFASLTAAGDAFNFVVTRGEECTAVVVVLVGTAVVIADVVVLGGGDGCFGATAVTFSLLCLGALLAAEVTTGMVLGGAELSGTLGGDDGFAFGS
jgi:hypothetical protein